MHHFLYPRIFVLIFFTTWIGAAFSQSTEACIKKINSCACETEGGYINLEKLDQAKQNGQPKWSAIPDVTLTDTTYAYNPCTAFTSTAPCTSVAGCQTQYSNNYAMGTQESATFQKDTTLGTTLVYTNTGGTFKVQLVCDADKEGDLTNAAQDPSLPYDYSMTLTTKYACSDIAPPPAGHGGKGSGSSGLSPGSIMLIVFFVCITVYLVGGILFNKFYRGANGKEIVPQVDFWIALPGLARDGALFSWNKVRSLGGKRANYDDV